VCTSGLEVSTVIPPTTTEDPVGVGVIMMVKNPVMLESDKESELELLEEVNVVMVNGPTVTMLGSGLELGVTIGGTISPVVFRGGHPEVPASRRTGH